MLLLDPYRFGGGGPPVVNPAWDPTTVSSPLALSLSNKRLTLPVNNSGIAKTTKGLNALSGKVYWEVSVVNCIPVISTSTGFGIAESTFAFGSANLAGGSTTDSGGIWLSGDVYFGGGIIASMPFGFSPTDIAIFAYDSATGKFWVGGVNSAGAGPGFSGNPAAGTGQVRTLNTSKTYYPAATPWSSNATNAVVLDILGSGNIVGTPPAGFTPYS